MALLEIACFNSDNALLAANAGADRIELCSDAKSGGTTPSYEDLCYVKANVTIPVFVMIRPRGGNFTYTDSDMETMKADIRHFKPHADEYVFGVLELDGRRIDIARTAELVEWASPMPCTFHRAFDEVLDHLQALENAITAGCSYILTSGKADAAVNGAQVLTELVRQAAGRIIIIPGGGVRSSNLGELQKVGASVYHSSALSGMPGGQLDINQIKAMQGILGNADGANPGIRR